MLYYKIYIVYRDFITTLIIGVLNYTIMQNFTFSRAFISQIKDCFPPHYNTWPEAIFVYFTRSTLFTIFFNMKMHYPQWNYITVPSFMFGCATISELRLLKRKKKKKQQKKQQKMENLQNGLLLFLTLSHASNYTIL